jgi:hypothetical protein
VDSNGSAAGSQTARSSSGLSARIRPSPPAPSP